MNTYSFEEFSLRQDSECEKAPNPLHLARTIFDSERFKITEVSGLVQLPDGEVVPLGELVVLELEVMVFSDAEVRGIGGSTIVRCIDFTVDDLWRYQFWRET